MVNRKAIIYSFCISLCAASGLQAAISQAPTESSGIFNWFKKALFGANVASQPAVLPLIVSQVSLSTVNNENQVPVVKKKLQKRKRSLGNPTIARNPSKRTCRMTEEERVAQALVASEELYKASIAADEKKFEEAIQQAIQVSSLEQPCAEDEAITCAICLDDLVDDSMNVVSFKCSHIFCAACMQEYLNHCGVKDMQTFNCPQCRTTCFDSSRSLAAKRAFAQAITTLKAAKKIVKERNKAKFTVS